MPIKAGKCILGNEEAVFEFSSAVQREQYTFSSLVKRILKMASETEHWTF